MVDVSHIVFGRMISGLVEALRSIEPNQSLLDAFMAWSSPTTVEVLVVESSLARHFDHPFGFFKSWNFRRGDTSNRTANQRLCQFPLALWGE